jgi:hypothetical protein
MNLIPKDMAKFLKAHPYALREGARGVANDQVPEIKDVEEQFQRIVALSEEQRSSPQLVRELGTLAHMVQLFIDPSATRGMAPLREQFEVYGDEYLNRLVVNREPFWAIKAPLDPRPALVKWAAIKKERLTILESQIDPNTGSRTGSWDILSPPFAQLQLSYSNGVNATANIWIQLWRAVGDTWNIPGGS